MKAKKGFTLVELIVVMAIIGILATLGFSSYTNSINKSKDARRKADLRSIMTALQLYYNDNGQYPSLGCGINCFVKSSTSGVTPWIPALTSNYIKSLPVDPVNNGTDPWSGGLTYEYGNVSADGQSFDLVAQLEWHKDPDTCQFKAYTNNFTGKSWCPGGSSDSASYLYQQQVP
jgi:type II secretion system protein G